MSASGSSREAPVNWLSIKDALFVVARGHELLCDKIHAVVETAHDADIGSPVVFVNLLGFMMFDLEDDGHVIVARETFVDPGGKRAHMGVKFLVMLDARPRRRANLDEAELADPLGLQFEHPFDREKSLEYGSPQYTDEMLKQESIYKSQGEQRPEGYVIDRSLSMYVETLSSDFDRTLANLGPKDRWMDIGAGMGQAILDYSTPVYDLTHPERRGKKAQAVAMSIEDRRTPAWHHTAASLGENQLQFYKDQQAMKGEKKDIAGDAAKVKTDQKK